MVSGTPSRDPRIDATLQAAEQSLIRGDIANALQLAEQADLRSPGDARTLRLLGAALGRSGRHDEALGALERALTLAPNDALIHNSLGACLTARGERARAIAAFQRAGELNPDLIPAWQNLSMLLFAEQRIAEALVAVDEVLARAPHIVPARVHRGAMLLSLGRADEAAGEYRRASEEDPANVGPWLGLAGIKSYRFSDSEVERIRALHRDARLGQRDRGALEFVLAKILDDAHAHAEAFAMFERANATVRKCVSWDVSAFHAEVGAILDVFPRPAAPSSSERGAGVIFIVSLPRSGSSLIEQILASHPSVEGAGELVDIDGVIAAESAHRGMSFVAWAPRADDEDWQRMGEAYLRATARWRLHKPFFTDKLPGNWRYVGAIRAMLPGARVIVCRRDPLETALSCYRQHFGGNAQAWSYDIASIAAYWHDFDRAARHWLARDAAAVHVQQYEMLVDRPEEQIRALLEFCGLPFDPACLAFHETERGVSTLSASQVREPLRSDTARAARYSSLLDPLREALEKLSSD